MGLHAAGEVVFLPFPFSDLSRSKLRPALLISSVGESEWIACQITSNPYIDPLAIPVTATDFEAGGLRHTSFIRPGKLFTAHHSLIASSVGSLKPSALEYIRDSIVAIIQAKRLP